MLTFVELKVSLFLLLVIVDQTFCGNQTSNIIKCERCKPRHFTHDANVSENKQGAECECNRYQFCSETNLTCTTCGECFNFWDNKVQKAKDETEMVLKEMLENNDIDLDNLKSLVNTLHKTYRTSKEDLNKLNLRSNEINDKINNVTNIILSSQQLFKKLQQIVDAYKSNSSDVTSIINAIKDLETKILALQNNIKEDFDKMSEVENVDELIKSLQTIHSDIMKFNTFPQVERSNFSLALSTENYIAFLEDIMLIENQHNNSSISNVQADMKKLFEEVVSAIIYLTRSIPEKYDAEKLKQNASKSVSDAAKLKDDLNEALSREKKFKFVEDYYNKLLLLIKTTNENNEKINKINESTSNFLDVLNITSFEVNALEKLILKEHESYMKERNALNINLKEKGNLDQLLEMATKEVKQISDLNVNKQKSINELENEIENIISETEKCATKLWKYCRAELARRKQ